MSLVETNLECIRGDDNVYDIDLSVALVAASDQIWFSAKRRRSDLDTAAVIKKGLNVTGLSGIVVTSEANGQFQVTLVPADTDALVDQALLYDVQLKKSGDAKVRTVARGLLLLSGEISEATS